MRCKICSHAFLPAREDCPSCLSADPEWQTSSGRAKLVSWVVYHRAFHPAFADRIPYTAAIIELEEGPRLISNIIGVEDPEKLTIDEPLLVEIENDDGVYVPRFRTLGAGT